MRYPLLAGVDRDGEEILPPCRVEHIALEDWLAQMDTLRVKDLDREGREKRRRRRKGFEPGAFRGFRGRSRPFVY